MKKEEMIEAIKPLFETRERIIMRANSMRKERELMRTLAIAAFGKLEINERCGNCWGDLLLRLFDFLEIKINQKQLNIMQTKKSNFVLREGKLLTTHGSATSHTNHNLTDKAAIDYIARMSVAAAERWVPATFSSFPDNWRELVSARKAEINSSKGATPAPNPPADHSHDYDNSNDLPDTGDTQDEQDPFEGKSRDELKQIAEDLQYPREEWSRLGIKNLTKYLKEKAEI